MRQRFGLGFDFPPTYDGAKASSHFHTLGKSERTITGAIFNVYAAMLDIETGERGFFVTGQDKYLEPYHRGAVELEAAFNELRNSFRHDAEGGIAVDRLHALGSRSG